MTVDQLLQRLTEAVVNGVDPDTQVYVGREAAWESDEFGNKHYPNVDLAARTRPIREIDLSARGAGMVVLRG